MFRFIQFCTKVVSLELKFNDQSVASFHDLFVNTDLRLSSLHFAISSAVSSLILLAPGAWFCKQEEKNTDVSKEKYSESNYFFMSHEAAVGHWTLQRGLEGGGQWNVNTDFHKWHEM